MLKNNIFFVFVFSYLFLQLMGAIFIYLGVYDIGPIFRIGNDIGAVLYFSWFIFIYSFTYLLLRLFIKAPSQGAFFFVPDHMYFKKIKKALSLNFYFLVFCVLVKFYFFGGYEAITSEISRGELRRTVFFGGPLQPLLTTWMPKFLVVYISICYILLLRSGFSIGFSAKIKFYLSVFFAFFTALMSGFKGGFIVYLMPVFFIWVFYSNKSSFFVLLKIFLLIFSLVFLSYGILLGFEDIGLRVDSILNRVLIVPASYPYHIVLNFPESGSFLEYSKTLVYFIGGTFFNLLVGTSFENMIEYNFGWKMTNLAGYGEAVIVQGGHSNTMSIIGESFYALGTGGVLIFAPFLAVLLYLLQRGFNYSLSYSYYFYSACILHLFWSGIIPWINGGGITRVLDINSLIFYIIFYFLYRFRLGIGSISFKGFKIKENSK